MRKRWWLVFAAAALAAVILAAAFWDSILVYAAPKAVLSNAMGNTLSGLQTRIEHSPLPVLARGMDKTGKNTIDLRLDTKNFLLGDIQYQMNVQTEGSPRQIFAEGTVISNENSLDLSVYLNRDFAAVSSKSLLDGNFYGITYDTFSEDLRSIPLLPLLLGENILGQWEESVSELQEQMEKTYAMPRISWEDMQMMLFGILALKAEVAGESLPLNGQEREVHQISFSATGPQIASAAEGYTHALSNEIRGLVEKLKSDPNAELTASFYVYEEAVVKLSLALKLQGNNLQLEVLPGMDAAKDNLEIAAIYQKPDSLDKLSVSIETQYESYSYSEKMEILRIGNGVENRRVIDYHWNKTDGELRLNMTEGEYEGSVLLNLQPTETGFQLSTDQFEDLMNLFREEKETGSSACLMTVSKGASITAPEYKNLDRWSSEDILILLEGLGSLFGVKI